MKKGEKTRMHSSFVRRALLGVAALCVVTLGAVPTAFGAPPTVVTANGTVVGKRAFAMNEYLGIPYAAPPVGLLRWMPPQPYGPFPGLISKRRNSAASVRNQVGAARIACSSMSLRPSTLLPAPCL